MSRSDRQLESSILALIGTALLDQKLPPVAVDIPVELVHQAVAAWNRDDEDAVPMDEPSDDALIRREAGVLALIGLGASELEPVETGSLRLLLDPVLVSVAIRASERRGFEYPA